MEIEALLENPNLVIKAVVTQPDKKVGRKQELQASPIKNLAVSKNIPVLQPEKITKDFINQLEELAPELVVVVAYGLILPKKLLDLTRYKCINLHPSLLPKYRGPSPLQAALLNGDEKTGITIMLLDEKMDHGPILSQEEIEISARETGQSLHDKLAQKGAELLSKTIDSWILKKINPVEQDDSKATLCQLITREDGKINWQQTAETIERQIRALSPWPGTYTFYNKKRLKIIPADILESDLPVGKPGQTFLTANNELAVICNQGALVINELQLEGGKAMDCKNFVLGHKEVLGRVLG